METGAQRIRLPLVVLLVVLMTLLPIGPANAQRVHWRDTTGDMWLTDDSNGTTTAAPKATVGDIRRVMVRYRTRALRLRVSFVQLRRTGDSLGLKGDIRTKSGQTWHFGVAATPGQWRGTVDLLGPDFGEVSCRTAHRFNYRLNRIFLRIPSSCLHRPRWVRIQFGSVHAFFSEMKIYQDDPLSEGLDSAWSARIHRG
jgi:hypothetical protein